MVPQTEAELEERRKAKLTAQEQVNTADLHGTQLAQTAEPARCGSQQGLKGLSQVFLKMHTAESSCCLRSLLQLETL